MEELFNFVWKESFLSDAGKWDVPLCVEIEVECDWIGCPWGAVMITDFVATFYVKRGSLEFCIEKINYLASTQ